MEGWTEHLFFFLEKRKRVMYGDGRIAHAYSALLFLVYMRTGVDAVDIMSMYDVWLYREKTRVDNGRVFFVVVFLLIMSFHLNASSDLNLVKKRQSLLLGAVTFFSPLFRNGWFSPFQIFLLVNLARVCVCVYVCGMLMKRVLKKESIL